MKFLNKFAFHSLGVLFVVTIILTVGLYQAVKSYHEAARAFWGDSFDPDKYSLKLFDEFPLSYIIPEGGPLANAEFFNVCKESQILMVPVRQIAANSFEALCGFGSDTRIEFYQVEDEQLREMFLKNWNESHK